MADPASSSTPLIAQVLIEIEGQIDRSASETGAIVQRSDPLPAAVEVVVEDRYLAEDWTSAEFREMPPPYGSAASGYSYRLTLRRG